MSKNTNGPWHYQEESDAYTHIIRGSDNEFIGSAAQGSKGSSESDARLMAASPELLEALKAWKAWTEEDHNSTGLYFNEIMSMVTAAIAKAEGK